MKCLRAANILTLIVFGALLSSEAQISRHKGRSSPTVFAPEADMQGFENAQPPSDPVLDALLSSQEARSSSDDLEGLDREAKRKLFEAVRVDLTGRGEEDYVVLGNDPMGGADNHWFWIVRVSEGRAQILLFTQGLTVQLLRKRTNDYRDIKESWGGNSGSVTRIYRYRGSAYVLATEHSEESKP